MAASATTVNSALFSNPTWPKKLPAGVDCVRHVETLPTTQTDFAADRTRLIPLPDGVLLIGFFIECEDLDTNATETLDADIILVDDNGTTILLNAGTLFEDAITTPLWVDCAGTIVAADGDTVASLQFYVNTKSATPAEGDLTITLFYKGKQ